MFACRMDPPSYSPENCGWQLMINTKKNGMMGGVAPKIVEVICTDEEEFGE